MLKVLLVEDNPADVALTEEAMNQAKFLVSMNTAENGEQALFELESGHIPDLILLDLNMPRMDGREFLSIIKNKDQWKSIPVVVLTSSEANEDVVTSYMEHANCYIKKPVNFEGFKKVVNAIDDFWFTVVRLPTAPKGEDI